MPLIAMRKPKMIKIMPNGSAMTVIQSTTPMSIMISPKPAVRSLPSREKMTPTRPQTKVKGNKTAFNKQPM